MGANEINLSLVVQYQQRTEALRRLHRVADRGAAPAPRAGRRREGAAMRIGLFGRGRLGSAIAQAAGADLAWQVGREAAAGPRPSTSRSTRAPGAAVRGHLDWALDARHAAS